MATINDDMLVERLVPKVLSSIRAKAKAVETIPVKQDLEGITSIPCYDTTGGQFRNVLVPIDALKEPARTASAEAIEAANDANSAAEEANAAAASANEAAAAASEFAGKIVLMSEEEYGNTLDSGQIDESKLYFAYEE